MTHPLAALLEQHCRRQGAKMDGVSIGKEDDRSTWHFTGRKSGTTAATERALIQSFNETAETLIADDAFVDRKLNDPVMAALITVMAAQTTHTAEELRALVKTQLLDQ